MGKTERFVSGHRWCLLCAGAAIQIFTGVPAAWGVFQQAVCDGYALSAEDAAMVFSCVIAAFGVGCVLGGVLQDKKGPRAAGGMGTLLLAGGFCAAAWLPQQCPWGFYGAFSVPVGCGCAFLYPAVMSCAQKWYADRKGLATGVVGGAVGVSGAVLTLLGRWLIAGWGIRCTFVVLGVLMAAVCGAGSFLLVNPTAKGDDSAQKGAREQGAARDVARQDGRERIERDGEDAAAPQRDVALQGRSAAPSEKTGQRTRAQNSAGKRAGANARQKAPTASTQKLTREKKAPAGEEQQPAAQRQSAARDVAPKAMLRMPQYWLLAAATALGTPCVQLFSPVIVEMAQQRGLSQTWALGCIVAGSVCSAVGRLAMPWLSDKWGRRAVDLGLFAALALGGVAFAFARGVWVLIVYCALTLCYSGEAAVLPAACSDLFGMRWAGVDYGCVALGMTVGSLGVPLLARAVGGAVAPHIIAAAAPALGVLCLWHLRPTHGETL